MAEQEASMRVKQALQGVSGVHVTPYHSDGRINNGLLAEVIDGITNAGVQNIVTGGNTGEFYALTLSEIENIYNVAVSSVSGRAIVTAGVGRSVHEAVQLTQAAEKAGVDAVMVHQPPDPFASPRMLYNYIEEISRNTDLPVIAYARNPGLTPEHFIKLSEIDNVVAVKYAVPDPLRLAECIRATKGSSLQWICGLAESWALPFYAYGARGFTSGLVNINAQLSMHFYQSLEQANWKEARSLVEKIASFEEMRTLEQNGTNVTVVKDAMRLNGMDVGPVRPPGVDRLDDKNLQSLQQILDQWKQQ